MTTSKVADVWSGFGQACNSTVHGTDHLRTMRCHVNMLICDCNIWLKLQASGVTHVAFAIMWDHPEAFHSSESRQPFANASPMTNEHNASNEAGGPSWSSLSYGAILTYVLSSTSSMRTSSQIQRASNMGWHGWAGTTQLEAKYHQGEVAATTKHDRSRSPVPCCSRRAVGAGNSVSSTHMQKEHNHSRNGKQHFVKTRAERAGNVRKFAFGAGKGVSSTDMQKEHDQSGNLLRTLLSPLPQLPPWVPPPPPPPVRKRTVGAGKGAASHWGAGKGAASHWHDRQLHHDHFRQQEETATSKDAKCDEVIEISDEESSDQLHDGHEDIRDRRALWAKQSRCRVEQVPLPRHLPDGILQWLTRVRNGGLFDHLDVNNIRWIMCDNGKWLSIPLRGLRPKPAMWQRHHHMLHGTKRMTDVLHILRDKGKLKPGLEQAGNPRKRGTPAVWLTDSIWTACFYTRPPVEFVWILTSRKIIRHVNNSRVPRSEQHNWFTLDFDGIALHSLLVRMRPG